MSSFIFQYPFIISTHQVPLRSTSLTLPAMPTMDPFSELVKERPDIYELASQLDEEKTQAWGCYFYRCGFTPRPTGPCALIHSTGCTSPSEAVDNAYRMAVEAIRPYIKLFGSVQGAQEQRPVMLAAPSPDASAAQDVLGSLIDSLALAFGLQLDNKTPGQKLRAIQDLAESDKKISFYQPLLIIADVDVVDTLQNTKELIIAVFRQILRKEGGNVVFVTRSKFDIASMFGLPGQVISFEWDSNSVE
ncbi:hypothetical protein HD806DRAFT_545687 [Xylariaceae sp. AK1471]|nr:hypothetical protein HD806DRAFT_545687 [Xylariaceae sp. AK1471]